MKSKDKSKTHTSLKATSSKPALFVARDSTHFKEPDGSIWSDEPILNGKVYRRLDPEYYAWLYTVISRAKLSYEKGEGRLASYLYRMYLDNFTIIHQWAVKNLGKEKLQVALADKNEIQKYTPPALKAPPSPPDLGIPLPKLKTFQISKTATATINSVKIQALALSWTKKGLYSNNGKFRFPCGEGYGLICFLKESSTFGKITEEFIEIINDGITTRFYNPDVDQYFQTMVKL